MASVEVRDVRKVYRRDAEEVVVLDGLTLTIPDGAFVALMGPSGSGKTTLLNLIGGVDQPTSGDLVVGDTNIARLGGDVSPFVPAHVRDALRARLGTPPAHG